jgi:hypothetical protein
MLAFLKGTSRGFKVKGDKEGDIMIVAFSSGPLINLLSTLSYVFEL